LADYAAAYPSFVAAGCEVVAISVDPPERSAAVRDDLKIEFPVLSDPTRKTIIEWGLLNASEKGGIAIPATFVVDRDLVVRFSSFEDVMRRVAANEMLAFVGPESTAAQPARRGVNPGLMFVRAMGNAFRHGVRVKRD
jgi:peroxiredoxin